MSARCSSPAGSTGLHSPRSPVDPDIMRCAYGMQTLGGAIGPADAARLAWSLAALDALREDAAQALAPQLSALLPDDVPSLVR